MTNLLKQYHIGDWCKRGAWIILIIGVLEILVGIYTTFYQAGASGGAPFPFTIAAVLQSVFAIASPTLFYFLVLYSAGLILNYFATGQEVAVSQTVAVPQDEEEHEHAVSVSQDEEEHEPAVSVPQAEEEHEEEATQKQVK